MQALPTAPLFDTIAPEVAGMPLYRVVKRSLLNAIESGGCAPGDTLPSESEIAGAMGVSIGTLRRAVDELAAEHILVRRQGRGTFVATHHASRSLGQFFPVERSDGLREAPTEELVSFERSRVEGEPAHALGLRPGDAVVQVENRLKLQGSPVVYERITLPAALFKGLTERHWQERRGTLYQFYQAAFGVTVVRALERARAGAAERQPARVLGVAVGLPMLQVRRTALTFGDRPVEHRLCVINTARHDYVSELSQPVARRG